MRIKRSHVRKLRALRKQLKRQARNCRGYGEACNIVPSCVYIYESEFLVIKNETEKYPKLETGGFLSGWHKDGCPVIAFATGPGECAEHEVTRFKLDIKETADIAKALEARGLASIGSWHSHHRLGLCAPSMTDCGVMIESIKDQHSVLCGIANIVDGWGMRLRMYYFSRVLRDKHIQLPIRILRGTSPIRLSLEHEFTIKEATP